MQTIIGKQFAKIDMIFCQSLHRKMAQLPYFHEKILVDLDHKT